MDRQLVPTYILCCLYFAKIFGAKRGPIWVFCTAQRASGQTWPNDDGWKLRRTVGVVSRSIRFITQGMKTMINIEYASSQQYQKSEETSLIARLALDL